MESKKTNEILAFLGIAFAFLLLPGGVLKLILEAVNTNSIVADIIMLVSVGGFIVCNFVYYTISALKYKMYPLLLIWLVPLSFVALYFIYV